MLVHKNALCVIGFFMYTVLVFLRHHCGASLRLITPFGVLSFALNYLDAILLICGFLGGKLIPNSLAHRLVWKFPQITATTWFNNMVLLSGPGIRLTRHMVVGGVITTAILTCVTYFAIYDNFTILCSDTMRPLCPHELGIESELYVASKTASLNYVIPSYTGYRMTKLIILVHGYSSSSDVMWMHDLSDILLRQNVFVITIDWRRGTRLWYSQAVSNCIPLADYVSDVADRVLNNVGKDRSYVVCIGHSLGAHICAGASTSGQSVFGKIIALDPARPYFDDVDMRGVSSSSASLVEAISTSSDFGSRLRRGHRHFVINNFSQPLCHKQWSIWCDHVIAPYLLVDAISSRCYNAFTQCSTLLLLKTSCYSCRPQCRLSPCARIYDDLSKCKRWCVPHQFHRRYSLQVEPQRKYVVALICECPDYNVKLVPAVPPPNYLGGEYPV